MQILAELRKVIRFLQRCVDQFVLFMFGLADNMKQLFIVPGKIVWSTVSKVFF